MNSTAKVTRNSLTAAGNILQIAVIYCATATETGMHSMLILRLPHLLCRPFFLSRHIKSWTAGTVWRIASGLKDEASACTKKLLPAGALQLWIWLADVDHYVPAGEKSRILAPGKQYRMTNTPASSNDTSEILRRSASVHTWRTARAAEGHTLLHITRAPVVNAIIVSQFHIR